MNQNQMILLALKGALAEASPEEQAATNAAIKDVTDAVEKHGQYGTVALAIVALELEAKQA